MIVLAMVVLLRWTSPGDDGNVGTAAEYDIRYAADSTVLMNWTGATPVTGEPTPLVAGTQQSMNITLPNQILYLGLKARDEAMNWSPLSNIVQAVPPDTIPPAKILDLRIGP